MKKETFQYSSLKERIKTEYRVYIIAFIFILIADSIGQIKIPLGPGMLILFPIFYSLFMGILSGPQILKVMKEKEVTAASKLVIVAICPFIAKLGINEAPAFQRLFRPVRLSYCRKSAIWERSSSLCHLHFSSA